MWLFWLLGGAVGWFLIGCIIGSEIDHHRGGDELFRWMKACPLGYTFAVMLWPVWAVAAWVEYRRSKSY